MTPQKAISKVVNLKDYDSVNIGDFIQTELGDFVCMDRPNVYQPIDSRVWKFQHATDSEGEPFMDGKTYSFKN